MAGRAMESAVALESMLNFPFYYQDGPWNTRTDSIELRGRGIHRDSSSREMMTDPGGGISLPDQ